MFVVVEINGTIAPDPMLAVICPGKDLRVFGPFDTPDQGAQWIAENDFPKEKYVILRLEWQL
jgi:hypothetical protein